MPIFLRDLWLATLKSSVSRPSVKLSSRPSKYWLLFTGCRVFNFMRLPVKRVKSAALISFRSNPGDETSSVYDPRHHILNIEDRAKLPAEVRAVFVRHPRQRVGTSRTLSRKTRSMRALPPPRISTSTTSSPLEAATRSAISRTRSTSSAMNPVTYKLWQSRPKAKNRKWACAHWCASPNAGTTQQFSSP